MSSQYWKILKITSRFSSSGFKMPPKKKVVNSKNQNITSFFTKSGKRSNSDECSNSNKISKIDNNSVTPISPEQQRRIEGKKKEALRRLSGNKMDHLDIGESWQKVLEDEFSKPYYMKLEEFVRAERSKVTVYPPAHDVFSWTRFSDIKDLKVVIIGQDPYHGPKQAHGLCFSVQVGVKTPPSLVNMYKELEEDISGFKRPKHGHLVGWAEQGVLLLNAVLTVQASNANSHKDKGWEKLTTATIKWINDNLEGVVFILWGGYAQKKGSFINKTKHCVLSGAHPSPLSSYRGFFGCKHFSKTNEYLKKIGKKEIDWKHLPESL